MSTPNFRQTFITPDGRDLVIDIAKPKDISEIVDAFVVHSFTKPPVRQLCEYDDYQGGFPAQPDWLLDDVVNATNEPISLLARNSSSGLLVAVLLNDIKKRPAVDQPSEFDGMDPNLLVTTYRKKLYDGVDLFVSLQTDSLFHMNAVVVSAEYGRQGLATRLYQLSLDIAAGMGFKAAYTQAASIYTARLSAKLGLTTYKTVSYATLEHKGTRPFSKYPEVLAEHPTASLMARHLRL